MLEQGTYIDLPEKDYRAWEAINYSSLADFQESQDHALMEKEPKSYYEEGNAFELLVEDTVKGSTKFAERFFIADAPGAMPEDLARWIERGEDLESKYVWNKPDKKTGEVRLSLSHKTKHAWLDECRKTPGKMPMGTDQMAMLNKMVDNFFKLQPFNDKLSRQAGIYCNMSLAEILPIAFFQIPIIWYVNGVQKKALVDCMVETDRRIYAFDIKTATNIAKFIRDLRRRYWLQEIHYAEGLEAIFPGKSIVWRFLVAPKDEPHVAQPFIINPLSEEFGTEKYYDLCVDYQAWIDAGRPAKGWKELEEVEVFFK